MYLNAFFTHLNYVIIVFYSNIVNYEIIFCLYCTGFFLKKYKKSGPKYKDTLTYIATEGLGNIMGLYHIKMRRS